MNPLPTADKLQKMTDDELKKVMHQCFLRLDTPKEKHARQINRMCREIIRSREPILFW